MVVTHFPVSGYAARQVLRSGGSLIDAAVTAVSMDCVLSGGTSLAGILGGLVHDGRSGETVVVDGGFGVPAGHDEAGVEDDWLSLTQTGRAVMAPGLPRAIEELWSRFGKLEWASLLEPAIRLAAGGIPRIEVLDRNLSRRAEHLSLRGLPDVLVAHPDGLIRQPALAETLTGLAAEGAVYMTSGRWARKCEAAVSATGGTLRVADMEANGPRWVPPLRVGFADYDIALAPPPTETWPPGSATYLFGPTLAVALRLLETRGRLPRVSRSASADRLVAEIKTVEKAEALVADVGRLADLQTLLAHVSTAPAASETPGKPRRPGTHNFVAMDRNGNTVALMHTICADSWGDTGIFVDGVPLNNGGLMLLDEPTPAGGHLAAMGSGQITFYRDRPVLAIDLANQAQVETHLQLLSNLLLDGLDLGQTDRQPRWGAHSFDLTTGATNRGRHTDTGFRAEVLNDVEHTVGYQFHPGIRTGLGFWTGATYDPTTRRLAATADHRVTGKAFAD